VASRPNVRRSTNTSSARASALSSSNSLTERHCVRQCRDRQATTALSGSPICL
jgi:hypothetical protein